MPTTAPRAAGALLPAAAFLLTVSISPMLEAPAWTPRAALLLLIGAAGAPVLVWLAWRRVLPAMLALGWVGWAALSTALSDDPVASLLGLYNWGTGLLFVVALASCFALVLASSDCTRRRVAVALLAGAGVNAVVAAAQTAKALQTPPFETQFLAATGTLGNSAHLGALMTAALVVVAAGARRITLWRVALGIGLALALQASASRTSLVVAVGATVVLAAQRRWAPAIIMGLSLLIGIPATAAVAHGDRITGTTRLAAQQAGGLGLRIAVWEPAFSAMGERPVLGAGPGRFRAATLNERTRQQAATQAREVFVDAHNIAVEYAVTTGLVGAMLLLAFFATVLVAARGPWVWFALVMLGMHLVQPQSVVTTPLLFLALGLARQPPETEVLPVAVRVAQPAVAVGGAIAAMLLLLGDHALYEGRFNVAVGTALRAEQLLPPWPRPAAIVGRAYTFQFESRGHQDDDARAALRWLEEAARRAPDDPEGWITLARFERYLGEPRAAEHSLRRALAADRHSVQALNELGTLLANEGRYAEALELLRRSLAVAPSQPSVQRQIRTICAQAGTC